MAEFEGALLDKAKSLPMQRGFRDPAGASLGFLRSLGMNFSPLRSTSQLDPHKAKSLPMQRGFRDPAGARTQDPDIKSVVLYQLSYRIFRLSTNTNGFVNGSAKVRISR